MSFSGGHVVNDSFTNIAVAAVAVEGEPRVEEDMSIQEIVVKFLITGLPLAVATLSQFSFIAVIVAVVGRTLGVYELGGTALALGFINATAFAFAAGCCGALETVLSHTYGVYISNGSKGTMYMYGIYTQRMLIILLVISVPIAIFMVYADMFLEYLGQDPKVVYYTGVFCRIGVFAVPATQVFQLFGRYYACQHVTTPLSVVMLVSTFVNPVLQMTGIWLFGFEGSPIAWSLLFVFIDLLLLGHIYWSGLWKKTWGGWSRAALENLSGLLKLAVPSMAMMLSEWVLIEVIIICSGFAKPHELAAFSITVQIFGLSWGIASGTIILTSVFIGNAIGEGKTQLARRIANVSIAMVFATAMMNVTICWLLEDYIPYLFTNDESVVEIYRRLMRFVFPYHIFDTFQSAVMSILRGCALQKIGAVIIGIALCVLGAPIAFFLFFHLHHGVESLWLGPFLGVAVFGFPSYIYLVYWYIDWPNLKPHQEEAPDICVEEPQIEMVEKVPPSLGVDDDANTKIEGEDAENHSKRE